MDQHEKINYLEFPAKDIPATKAFFTAVFGWEYTDYGPDYVAVHHAGIETGFYQSDLQVSMQTGSVLIVFFSESLEETLAKVEAAGGTIIKPIFPFPGGRRFHFTDPNGNEFAVWGEEK